MDYRQTSVAGDQWQRCCHIEINNGYGSIPTVRFDEEKRIVLADGASIGLPVGGITKQFTDPSATFPLLDPTTGEPLGPTVTHGEVYVILWSMYMTFVAQRDAEQAAAEQAAAEQAE